MAGAKKLAVRSDRARDEGGHPFEGSDRCDGPETVQTTVPTTVLTSRAGLRSPLVVSLVSVGAAVAVFVVARLFDGTGGDAVEGLVVPRVPALTVLFRVGLLLALATSGAIGVLRAVTESAPARSPRSASSANLPDLDLFAVPTPRPRPGVVVAAWLAGGLGTVICAVGALSGQASLPECGVVVVLFCAVALYSRRDSSRVTHVVLASVGAVLSVVWAIVFAGVRAGAPEALDVCYAIAAAVFLGASIYGAAGLVGDRRPDPIAVRETMRRVASNARAWPARLSRSDRTGSEYTGSDRPGSSRDAAPRRAPHAGHALRPEAVATRLAWLAFGAGPVSGLVAVLQLALTGPRTWADAIQGGYGPLVLLQAVLPLAATLIWALAWRAVRRAESRADAGKTPAALWSAVAVMLVAVSCGAAVAALPRPPAAPVPGLPLLRPVALGPNRLAVLVTPMRPGPNLIQVSQPRGQNRPTAPMATAPGPSKQPLHEPVAVSAGGRSVTFAARPGASGQWAVIDIPPGTRTLTITSAGPGGSASAAVPIDVGTDLTQSAVQHSLAGPDGPECASAELGALAAGAQAARGCPEQSLDAPDVESLTEAVAFLAHQKITTFDLASDDSPRSTAAAALVRAQAARWGIRIAQTPGPNDTLLVTTGWQGAVSAVQGLTARVTPTSTGGAVLAPWLATSPILAKASSEMVPLRFNPERRPARAYVATLGAVFPGAAASPAGYLAWAQHLGQEEPGQTHFYGASRPDPAANSGANSGAGSSDDSSPDEWYPTGNIVAIKTPTP